MGITALKNSAVAEFENKTGNLQNSSRSGFWPKLSALSSAIALTLTVQVDAAMAQEAEQEYKFEEITVTATKKTEDLQEVPISVTAISGEQMREFGFTSATNIVNQAPNVEAASAYGAGSSATVTIRGIGQNDFGEGHEAPVTSYVDEVYLVAVPAVDFSLFDIDRVEVLRGPQGTLFGRNTTGGLIHYVTTKPSQENSAFISAGYGRFNDIRLEGAFGGGLTDSLSARVSLLYADSDGFQDNLTAGQPNGGTAGTKAVRGQLLYEPSSTFNMLFKAEYGEVDTVQTYYETVPLTAPDPETGLYGADRSPTATDYAGFNENNFGAGEPLVTTANYPTGIKQDGSTFSLRIEKQLTDVLRLVSLTSYQDLERVLSEDCDASANDICSADFPYQSDWITQDLRLEGEHENFSWVLGAYYLTQDATNQPSAVFNIPVDGPTALDPNTGLYNGEFLPIALSANWKQDTESMSAYGNIEYQLSDAVELVAGIRFTNDQKDFTDFDNATLRSCGDFFIPTNCFLVSDGGTGTPNPISLSRDEDLISWQLGVNYTPMDDILVYGSISRGTKGGGFNNGFYGDNVVEDPSLIEYGDEENTSYEIGLKSTLFDNRLRLNGSIFHYDYKGFQTFNWAGLGGLITNSDGTVNGSEIELNIYATTDLRLDFGLAYLDTNIEDVVGKTDTYVADRQMAFAPEFSANGAVSYNFDFGRVVWDWHYKGERFSNNFEEPASRLDSFFRHNITAIFDVTPSIQVSAYVRNIGDKIVLNKTFTFADLGYSQELYEAPRTWGMTVNYIY